MIPILIVAMAIALSSRLPAVLAIEVVLDPHVISGSRHQLLHVPRDLSNNRLEEVACAGTLRDRRDGVLVVEPFDLVGLFSESS